MRRLFRRDRAANKRAEALWQHAQDLHEAANRASPVYTGYRTVLRRTLREAHEAYLVSADAFEEAGKTRHAKRAQENADRIAQVLARPDRVYRRQRARGLPAEKAYERAVQSGWFTVVGESGSIDEGEVRLLVRDVRDPKGEIQMRVIQPTARGGNRFTTQHVELTREPLPSWVNAAEAASNWGISPTILRMWWRSPNVQQRAYAREVVASWAMGGWDNFDSYPTFFTRQEINSRYGRRVV